ncbi:MAG: RbsD/FucU domain-containing protein [Planctomycetota bacterium]
MKLRYDRLIKTLALVIAAISIVGCSGQQDWQDKLNTDLAVLGHRNWIVIADSAYPAQARAGIETIYTGQSQIETTRIVLAAVDKAAHVNPNIYLDTEIEYVSKEDAPGIDAYRKELSALLGSRKGRYIKHEELIAKLDEAAKTFRVLILKTDLTLPYTSVFLELDCGYWNPEAEAKMRKTMQKTGK